jgi:hypothetical protein
VPIEDSTPTEVRSRRRVVVVAVALGVLAAGAIIAVVASRDSDVPEGAATVTSTVAAPATTLGATATTPATLPTGTSPGNVVVTVAGTVKTVLPDGDFVVDDGRTDYTVAMSSEPTIVDLDGATAASDLIQLGGSVQVTGTVSGTTITAQTVIVPIRPAPPTSDT